MNTLEILLTIFLAALIAWAAARTIQKSQRGGGCCGEREADLPRKKARDRNKAHYPYTIVLEIGGMTCENCARKVEGALNALDGVWATVQIADRRAIVRTKEKPEEQLLRRAVQQAGYVVLRTQ